MKKTQRHVKIATAFIIVAALGVVGQTAQGYELINTATNEIAEVKNLGKQDVLEDIYADLDAQATETQSTFILVEQENKSVTLFTIAYPYEDYADTDHKMQELGTYDLMDLVN